MTNAAPLDLNAVYQAAGQEWNVDPNLLRAVAGQESGGLANPDQAVSSAGAQGRMQLMPGTAAQMGVTDTSDPVQNVYGGAKYLSSLLDKYGSPELALSAYNAGPGRVDDHLANGTPLPAETVAYVPEIARRYQALAGSQQQQPPANSNTAQPSSSAAPGTIATPNLDASMAALSHGQADPNAAPGASAPARQPLDLFSQVYAAAQAASGVPAGNSNTPAPASVPGPLPAAPAAAGGSATAPVPDLLSRAYAAAQAASAAQPGTTLPGAGAATSTAGQTPPQAAPMPAAGPTGYPVVDNAIGSFTHGVQSIGDALNRGAAYVDSKVPFLARLDAATGQNPAADVAAQPAQEAAYQARYGNSSAASVGNFVGQAAGTLPLIASGTGGLGALAGAGAEAVGGTATMAGRGIQAAADFAGGTASAADAGTIPNLLIRGTSLAANGAGQGAAINLLTGDPNATAGQNMLTGATAGAVLGPVGAAVGQGVARVGDGLMGLVRPFYDGGRNYIADTALAKAAGKSALVMNDATLVPGSVPTTAQAYANPGLASVERAVASVRPNEFANRLTSNNEARADFLRSQTGTPTDIEAADLARETTAVPAITGPLAASTTAADAQPVVNTIDQILASPAGQRDAAQRALGGIRSKLVQPAAPFGDRVSTALASVSDAIANTPGAVNDAGLWGAQQALVAAQQGGGPASTLARLQAASSANPQYQALIDQARNTVGSAGAVESDPGQLYGIRKAINDQLSPLAANAGSDAQLAASELQQVKASLDNSIEGAAPGFKKGLDEYAAASQPINAMQYLQSKGYTAADGTITMAKVKNVLDDIGKQQNMPGARDAKAVPADTVTSLQSLYDDLLRQNNSRLGMSLGSNTFQNLATGSTMAGLGAPLTKAASLVNMLPGGNLLTGGAAHVYGRQNEAILDAVVNKLLNPAAGASIGQRAAQIKQAAQPAAPNANYLFSGVNAAAPVVNRLLGPQAAVSPNRP